MMGQGKLESKEGVYVGGMVGGLKEGYGHFTYSDGRRYVGNFVQGMRAGKVSLKSLLS